MPSILVLAGSPSTGSRTVALTETLGARLREQGHAVRVVPIRELPADALLGADTTVPAIADVLAGVAAADGVVVASPVYKAAYSGVLKVFLDLLPQSALAGKVVLPLLTGGSQAHTLALDHAVRPVLAALDAYHVVRGVFVLDSHIERTPDGALLADAALGRVDRAVAEFTRALRTALVPAS